MEFISQQGTLPPIPDHLLLQNKVVVFESFKNGKEFHYFETKMTEFSNTHNGGWQKIRLVNEEHELKQDEIVFPVIGFGGSFSDATCILYSTMNSHNKKKFKEAYFSRKGLEYNFCRIPIGSHDFSCRDDKNQPTNSNCHKDNSQYVLLDQETGLFKLEKEDVDLRIPLILECMDMTKSETGLQMKFLASPWGSPTWMKSSGVNSHGHLLKEYYDQWAQYNIEFLELYSQKGIEIFGLTFQNEPYEVPRYLKNWQNTYYTSEETIDYVSNHIGPRLRDYNHSKGKKIQLIIHDDSSHTIKKSINLLADENFNEYVDGIAFHWYTNFLFHSPRLLKHTHETLSKYNKWDDRKRFILASEACEGYIKFFFKGPQLYSWKRGQNYAKDIIKDLNNYVSSWVDWNMVLNMKGGPNWANNYVDAPILYDEQQEVLHFQPMFYFLGHFTKFIKPGSRKILFQSQGIAALECTCFIVNDLLPNIKKSVVIVVLNRDVTMRKYYIICGKDKYINLTIPAHGIQTIMYKI